MKIQINSLAALERLIGRDTELEIEGRNNIVHDFAKKRLTPLINEPELDKIKNDIIKAGEEKIKNYLETNLGHFSSQEWNKSFVLKDSVKASIQKQTAESIQKQLDEATKSIIDQCTQAYMEKQIIKIVDQQVEYKTKEGVKAGLAELSAKF